MNKILIVAVMMSLGTGGAMAQSVESKNYYCDTLACLGATKVPGSTQLNLQAYCGTKSSNKPASELSCSSSPMAVTCVKDATNVCTCNQENYIFKYEVKFEVVCE